MKQRMCSLFLALVLLLSLAVPAAATGTMPFTDVKESDWFYSYVKTMYDNELVSGTTPPPFSPQDPVPLGEARQFILNAAGYTAPTTSGKNWASGYYQLAQEKGFLNSSWSLGLNDAMNRLQIAELIVNVLGVERKQQTASPFTDTSDVAALILSDHGIFEGTTERDGKTYFYPQRNISRAEISTVICRVNEFKKNQEQTPDERRAHAAARRRAAGCGHTAIMQRLCTGCLPRAGSAARSSSFTQIRHFSARLIMRQWRKSHSPKAGGSGIGLMRMSGRQAWSLI